MQETQWTQLQSLGQEDPLEAGMATHSSPLAWRVPWTEEPGGLRSMGSQKSQTRLSSNSTLSASIIPGETEMALNGPISSDSVPKNKAR